MTRHSIRTLCLSVAAFAMIGLLSACAVIDKVADKRIGPACTDQVRYDRSTLFTDVLEKHYGQEFPAQIEQLRHKTELMHRSLVAGASLDAAGDSYKGDFVVLAGKILLKRGDEVKLGGFDEAADRLKKLPHLVADINEVEALVLIACAQSSPGGAAAKPGTPA